MKKALDVLPNYNGIWCSIADGDLFVNTIVSRRWSKDGRKITFMLDTHNFYFSSWDEEIQVVEITPDVSENTKKMWAESDDRTMGPRPVCCKTCGHILSKEDNK